MKSTDHQILSDVADIASLNMRNILAKGERAIDYLFGLENSDRVIAVTYFFGLNSIPLFPDQDDASPEITKVAYETAAEKLKELMDNNTISCAAFHQKPTPPVAEVAATFLAHLDLIEAEVGRAGTVFWFNSIVSSHTPFVGPASESHTISDGYDDELETALRENPALFIELMGALNTNGGTSLGAVRWLIDLCKRDLPAMTKEAFASALVSGINLRTRDERMSLSSLESILNGAMGGPGVSLVEISASSRRPVGI